jgi:hypothetical protein
VEGETGRQGSGAVSPAPLPSIPFSLSLIFSGVAIHPFLLTPRRQVFTLEVVRLKGENSMAKVTITFSDAEQQRIEGIVIDKDQDEALRYLADLLDKVKGHPGHACGPKVV